MRSHYNKKNKLLSSNIDTGTFTKPWDQFPFTQSYTNQEKQKNCH